MIWGYHYSWNLPQIGMNIFKKIELPPPRTRSLSSQDTSLLGPPTSLSKSLKLVVPSRVDHIALLVLPENQTRTPLGLVKCIQYMHTLFEANKNKNNDGDDDDDHNNNNNNNNNNNEKQQQSPAPTMKDMKDWGPLWPCLVFSLFSQHFLQNYPSWIYTKEGDLGEAGKPGLVHL